jgi:2-(1,2-epoxy-1,2-dihydrophenyl)acetyl-CoA isomerase
VANVPSDVPEQFPVGGVSSTEGAVLYRMTDRVAYVTLNRPSQLNAVNTDLVEGLCFSLDRAIADEADAVILSGNGRSFCAGHDFKEVVVSESDSAARQRIERLQDVTRKIQQIPAPVIAAVHGYALGAGCEFALCCDMIVADTESLFGFPEVEVGLAVTGGISRLLPAIVGPAKAKELILLGVRFDAAEGVRLGLVNAVSDDALATAVIWAKEMAGRPRLAFSLAKSALNRGLQGDLDAAFEREIVNSLLLRGTPDAADAANAFRQKSHSKSQGD